MRIYRDVEFVESLGSGIPRILRAYGEDSFKFTDNFIRITLPVSVYDENHDSAHEGTKLAPSVEKLIVFCSETHSFIDILSFMEYTDKTKFRKKFIYPLLKADILEQTIPDKPNSRNQKYQLTARWLQLKEIIMKQEDKQMI